MQLDENDPGGVAARPAARADGVLDRWFINDNPAGGADGTPLDHDFFNDLLGNIRALLARAGITHTKGPAGDDDLADAVQTLSALPNTQWGLNAQHDGTPTSFNPLIKVHNSAGQTGGATAANDPMHLMTLGGTMVKSLDAAFGLGTGAGGVADSLHPLTADEWLRFFIIGKADHTVDFGWDTDPAAVNLLASAAAAGFTFYRQIAWHPIDGSGTPAPWPFLNRYGSPDIFTWLTRVGVAVGTPAGTFTAIDLNGGIRDPLPPIACFADLRYALLDPGVASANALSIYGGDEPSQIVAAGWGDLNTGFVGSIDIYSSTEGRRWVNAAGEVYYDSLTTVGTLTIDVLGWVYDRSPA